MGEWGLELMNPEMGVAIWKDYMKSMMNLRRICLRFLGVLKKESREGVFGVETKGRRERGEERGK